LEAEVQEGRFLEALYYRLNVLTLRMPPLRDRLEDLPVIVEEILLNVARNIYGTVLRERPSQRFTNRTLGRFGRNEYGARLGGGANMARVGKSLTALESRDTSTASILYRELLEVVEDTPDGDPTVVVGFSFHRLLGLLADLLDDVVGSEAHFQVAVSFLRRADYRAELAWTLSDYAEALGNRESTDSTDGTRARMTPLQNEAISIANDTEYGLSSGIITRDEHRGLAIAEKLETGMCHINCSPINDEPHAPFGGVKSSGVGRYGGRWSMENFTETVRASDFDNMSS